MRQRVLNQVLANYAHLTGVFERFSPCEFRRLREGLNVFVNELVTIHAADWSWSLSHRLPGQREILGHALGEGVMLM